MVYLTLTTRARTGRTRRLGAVAASTIIDVAVTAAHVVMYPDVWLSPRQFSNLLQPRPRIPPLPRDYHPIG